MPVFVARVCTIVYTLVIARALSGIFNSMSEPTLTKAEFRVMELTVQGMSDKEIAKSLTVSPRTINFHQANIRQKVKCRNRVELTRWAITQGLVKVA